MKKMKVFTSMLILLVVFISGSTFGQTTMEEYNYVTKGYKIQIESGLDMKKGYTFTDLFENVITTGSTVRKCTFKALMRTNQAKPCAILCIYTRSDNNYSDYVCIPTTDSPKEIWDKAYEKFDSYSGASATVLITGLSKLAAFYANK